MRGAPVQPTPNPSPPAPDGLIDRLRGSLSIVVGIVVLVTGAAFAAYGLPESVQRGLAEWTGLRMLLPPASGSPLYVQSSKWALGDDAIPAAAREPLPDVSGIRRLDALRGRRPLTIEATTLSVTPAGQPVTIVTPILTLRDAVLLTRGAPVTIEIETLKAQNSVLRAFPPEGAADRGAGRTGGVVRLIVHGGIAGTLAVDLSGEGGATGQPGAAGQRGGAGEKGARARSRPDGCQVAAARGTTGGQGTPGGAGEAGAHGGNGGILEIIADDPKEVAAHINFIASGGAGGPGGAAGAGGAGGSGGLGGDPAGLCFGNGEAGRDGPTGPAGAAGSAGAAGTAGDMRLVTLGAKP